MLPLPTTCSIGLRSALLVRLVRRWARRELLLHVRELRDDGTGAGEERERVKRRRIAVKSHRAVVDGVVPPVVPIAGREVDAVAGRSVAVDRGDEEPVARHELIGRSRVIVVRAQVLCDTRTLTRTATV